MTLRRKGYEGWLCAHHDDTQTVLSADTPSRTHVMIVESTGHGQYWRNEGDPWLASGLQTGPGFLAYAKDFPVGTKLIVTAAIEFLEGSE